MAFKIYNERRKYGNHPTEYKGVRYDSKKEAEYARDLDLLLCEKGGKLKEWKRQVKIDLCVNGKKITRIVVDFLEIYRDGHERFVEIKSEATKTKEWIIKWTLFDALHPDWDKSVYT